jgi:hypothetical protein
MNPIHQHDAACRAQGCHDFVALGTTIAAVAHHVLMVCIEGASGLDPLPLIRVGDRMGEDLFVRLNRVLLVGDRCGVAFLSLSQPVQLPVAQADEGNAEHGNEDDQQ